MITRADLDAAIAECVGERDPNANTCIKLAAYYTIRDALYPEQEQPMREVPQYSYAAEPVQPTAHINSGSEFAQAVEGLPLDDVWSIVDELLVAVMVSQPALYRAVLRRLKEL
jgi:hypothetical protein